MTNIKNILLKPQCFFSKDQPKREYLADAATDTKNFFYETACIKALSFSYLYFLFSIFLFFLYVAELFYSFYVYKHISVYARIVLSCLLLSSVYFLGALKMLSFSLASVSLIVLSTYPTFDKHSLLVSGIILVSLSLVLLFHTTKQGKH